jgi:hypothetical protein
MNKQNKLIGRVLATEKTPTTMDKFNFWTNSDLKLHAFDIVKVEHIDNSFSFGVIENISHITDAQSFLTNFISSDFGDVNVEEPTLRVGMNYAEAAISFNDKNIYTPVHNNARVYLATAEEITACRRRKYPKVYPQILNCITVLRLGSFIDALGLKRMLLFKPEGLGSIIYRY